MVYNLFENSLERDGLKNKSTRWKVISEANFDERLQRRFFLWNNVHMQTRDVSLENIPVKHVFNS